MFTSACCLNFYLGDQAKVLARTQFESGTFRALRRVSPAPRPNRWEVRSPSPSRRESRNRRYVIVKAYKFEILRLGGAEKSSVGCAQGIYLFGQFGKR